MMLVTGATGYLGSHLVLGLMRSNRNIRALKRENSKIPNILSGFGERIEWVNGDLRDIISLEQAFQGIETVFHCAGILPSHTIDVPEMLSTNIEGTQNMVNLSLEFSVKKFLYVSSVSTLYPNEGDLPLKTVLNDFNKSKSPYTFGKIEAEKEVWRGIMEGLPAIIIHPSLILSSINDPFPNPHLQNLYKSGSSTFLTSQFGIIGIEDLVEAMLTLLDSKAWGGQFVISSENISGNDLLRQIHQKLNLPIALEEYKNIGWRAIFKRSKEVRDKSKTGIQELIWMKEDLKPVNADPIKSMMERPFKTLSEFL